MNFCDILKKSEKKYLILIAILSCLHAMNGFMYSSIPFIFFDPVLTCTSNINGTLISFPCNQNTACDNFQYEINYEASYKSITTEFELICSQRFIKPTVQSLSLAGTAITGLTMSFVRLDPYKRSRIVMISYTIGATAALISSLLYNIWAITAAICIYYMFSYVWYSNIYTFASETFEPPLKKIVPSILSSCYGIGTMSFAMFTIKVDNWRYQMAFFYAIPTLFFLLCFFLHNRRHDFKPKNLVFK